MAATEDYRFEPINENELESLSYIVSVLSTPERVLTKNASDNQKTFSEKINQSDLDPKEYGIIIKSFLPENTGQTDKAGLLLPGLRGVDTVKKQISITCQKAGIDQSKETFSIYRFTIKKHQ